MLRTNRWPITPEIRQAAVERLNGIMTNEDSTARDVTNAGRVLVQADAMNVRREQGPAKHQHLHLHGDGPVDEAKPQTVAELRDVLSKRRAAREALPAPDATEVTDGPPASP